MRNDQARRDEEVSDVRIDLPAGRIVKVPVKAVIVVGDRRECDPEAVSKLAESMLVIDLKTPPRTTCRPKSSRHRIHDQEPIRCCPDYVQSTSASDRRAPQTIIGKTAQD
jgi:hypothetical protein